MLLILFLVAVQAAAAKAVTKVVYNTADKGQGSLRAAIESATGGETIHVSVSGVINLTSGSLVIDKELNIEGPGADRLTVRRSGSNGLGSRVFVITSSAATISGLTISDGDDYSTGSGAGIYSDAILEMHDCIIRDNAGNGVYNRGFLTMINCSVVGNTDRGDGAGINNYGGNAVLSHCTFSNNSGLSGGGIANSGSMEVKHCTFNGNSADRGGGINNHGTLTVSDTTFSGNYSNYDGGGAIYSDSSLAIDNSTFADNTATGYGGALLNYGSVALESSTFSNNTSIFNGGGLANAATMTMSVCTLKGNRAEYRGGGLYNIPHEFSGLNATTTISRSSFIDNHAGEGGGIAYRDGTVTISISTLSGNSADVGGGVWAGGGMLTARNCTISSNSATEGGGIHNGGITNLVNDIVAGNSNDDYAGNAPVTNSHNLLSGEPKLGPLQDNGGPTLTMALLPGSPAIDAGNNGSPVTTDQRGVKRQDGDGDGTIIIDIGANESAAAYSIRGYVRTTDLSPIEGASVQLRAIGGATWPAVTTGINGYYAITAVPPGHYSLTAFRSGFSFSPSPQTLRVRTTARGANFTGTPIPSSYSISGRISDYSGRGLPGVGVGIGPPPAGLLGAVTTNSSGYFRLPYLRPGTYYITPGQGHTTFLPANRLVTINNSPVARQNFIASTGYTLTGRIATSNGIGISGASVQIDGGAIVSSNSAGYYTLYNVADGSHNLVASKTGYTFTPSPKTVVVNGANLHGQNFTGTGPG